MDNLIPQKYRSYGNYVNSSRALPLDLDGLKPVERRVLLSAYLVARNKSTKCPRVDGTCIARFHPHSSTYGTIVQMVNQGFLQGQGQFGNNLGVDPSPPAAMRYTECMLKPETYELMFKYIKHVPWVESESKDDREPLYLPTMYPVCLMGTEYTQGIGFGFRTVIPTYSSKDLYKRLMWLLKIRKTRPTIKPISDCVITADDTILEQLLTTGKASISVKGVLKTSVSLCKVAVKSWPWGRRFSSILNKPSVKKMLDNQDIGYIDSSNKRVGTEIVFSVLKQRNRDKIFADCIEQLEVATTGSVSFEVTVTDIQSNTRLTSIDNMLLNTFNMYTNVSKKMLQHEIDKMKEVIAEYKVLEKLRDPLSKLLQSSAFLAIDSIPKKAEMISQQSGVNVHEVKELLTKYKIWKLLTMRTDTKMSQLKIAELQDKLTNIQTFVLDQYKT